LIEDDLKMRKLASDR